MWPLALFGGDAKTRCFALSTQQQQNMPLKLWLIGPALSNISPCRGLNTGIHEILEFCQTRKYSQLQFTNAVQFSQSLNTITSSVILSSVSCHKGVGGQMTEGVRH